MAHSVKLTDTAANAACDAVVDLLDGGTILGYDGTIPATAATAITTQTLLFTLTFGSPAFGSASAGVATANTITDDTDADATGDVTFCRLKTSGGTTLVQGTAGESGCDLNIETDDGGGHVVIHGNVHVSSCTYTVPKA